jgi:mannose-6-phosphate isomerase-like protein (cupin superfamily)
MFAYDAMIAKAINDYAPIVNANRSFPSGLSKYRVEKPWGYEIWLDVNRYFALKLIHMEAGHRSSLQSHKLKREANYVIEGAADVLLENGKGEMERHTFIAGTGWKVKPGQRHRVIAQTSYTAIEVSSPHLDDVIRHDDDSKRKSGKVEKEHK